jgi:exodeoxyribonuclease-3
MTCGVRLVCVYVPNGQSVGSDKYEYKLRWYGALAQWLRAELAAHPRIAVLGDFNVAPEDRDVHDPAAWRGQVLFSDPRRPRARAAGAGLRRRLPPLRAAETSFSWWDYRMMAFRRKMGLRIDHVLLSHALAPLPRVHHRQSPRKLERPSDHAPVICELA